MSTLEYTGALSVCGLSAPRGSGSGKPLDIDQPQTLEELFASWGPANLGGLGGFLLHKSVQHEMLVANEAEDISEMSYRIRGQIKVPDAGLATGMKVMGMLAQRGIEAIRVEDDLTTQEMVEVLISSKEALPIAFANMANRDNRRVEVLYGVRDGGAYNEESARYELYQNDDDEFGFVYKGGELVPTNFDKVKRVLDNPGRCAALKHPVFTASWEQISQNTAELLSAKKELKSV